MSPHPPSGALQDQGIVLGQPSRPAAEPANGDTSPVNAVHLAGRVRRVHAQALPPQTGLGRRASRLVDLGMLPLLALLVPLFWFPWHWPRLTLAALPVIPLAWVVGWRLRGRLTARTGLEAPLVYVLLATCVATIPIADWQLGLPKVLGMVLGAATLVAIANAVASRQAVAWAVAALAGMAFFLAAAGLVGAEWITGKLPALDRLASRLPPLIRGMVPNTSRGGIHPNELAGTLVLLLPVLLAQAVGGGWRGRASLRSLWALLAGLAALAVLAATQSRSGLTGAGVALALLGGAVALRVQTSGRRPRLVRWAVPAVYLCALSFGVWAGWQMLARWMTSVSSSDVLDSFESRLELWERALSMLQDFAFTGIGLGQFNPVLHTLYVPLLLWGQFVPHAHNIYLEYALELGVPGAVAFACLVLAFLRQCARAARSADPLLRWTGLGLAFGIAGFGVYGLTDAIAPGARAGLVLWVVLGMGAAVGNVSSALPLTTRG